MCGVSLPPKRRPRPPHNPSLRNLVFGKRQRSSRPKTIRYIENNPTKAKLVLDRKDWPWSSARFRDESGLLRLERRTALRAAATSGVPHARIHSHASRLAKLLRAADSRSESV